MLFDNPHNGGMDVPKLLRISGVVAVFAIVAGLVVLYKHQGTTSGVAKCPDTSEVDELFARAETRRLRDHLQGRTSKVVTWNELKTMASRQKKGVEGLSEQGKGTLIGSDETSDGSKKANPLSSVEQACEPGTFWMTAPLPSNDGYTWSMTSRIGDMLKEAEFLLGPRDETWTILGVELRADKGAVPQNWFPGYPKRKNIVFQVVPPANTDRAHALFQLAHEVVHSLSPHVGKTANVLEEGVATWFAERYARNATGEDIHSSLRSYANARDIVAKMLRSDEAAIRRLRALEPDFSCMTAKTFKDAHIAIDEVEVKALLAAFSRE